MRTIKINLNNVTGKQIDLIVDYLKRGRVLAYPTDTIYGLGCDARNVQAIKKIKKIKDPASANPRYAEGSGEARATAGEAERNKPLLALISDFEMLRQYCEVNEEQEKYLKKAWVEQSIPPSPPLSRGEKLRPTTVILENRKNLPDELTDGRDSIAARLPKSDFLIKIISKAGFPIVSTSLNKTGEPPLASVRELEKYFDELPDLAVDAGVIAGNPSRLVDLRDVGNIRVIRE